VITNLSIAAGPVELQTNNPNNVSAPQSNTPTAAVRTHGNISIPHFLTISNSPPTVVQSNANGYAVVQIQTITRGPLFWPILGVAISLVLLVCWMGVRSRGRN
jgi:hypothetical protein